MGRFAWQDERMDWKVSWPRRSEIIQGLLFVFLGIPGTIVFTFGVLFAVLFLLGSVHLSPGDPVLLAVALIGGGICLLIGSGRLRQWPYLAVFVVFGASLACFSLLLQRDLALSVVPAGLTAIVVSYLIRRFYAPKSK